MERNVRLANIYIKIHNKAALTIDDMQFLAIYDPECFDKTCKNLFYKIPETKKLAEATQKENTFSDPDISQSTTMATSDMDDDYDNMWQQPGYERAERDRIEIFLNNLKSMEIMSAVVKDIDSDRVKNLVGSLYMEKLFPHNDRTSYFEMYSDNTNSSFNKKV